MGCFCKQAVAALQRDAQTTPEDKPEDQEQPEDRGEEKIVKAVGTWLAARWLPAPRWEPDPEWLELELPEPPMPPAAFTVISGLVQAQQACTQDLGFDPAQPDQLAKFSRIIRTLNRRMDDLQALAEDDTPWDKAAALNDEADAVRAAATQGLLDDPDEAEEEPEEPLGPWRPLLTKVKALAPLVSIFRTLDVDPSDEAATDVLADRVRKLRAVTLPMLDQPLTVFKLITRYSAAERLQRSLGADPRQVPFERVWRAVQRKVDAVAEQLPQRVRMAGDQLVGMPQRQPNPSQLLTPAVIDQVRRIQPEPLNRMRWQVPRYDQIDLLTVGAPVTKLVGLLKLLGTDPVRASPCDRTCDAGAARSPVVTGSRDTGTGAAPAG